jgi:hypothetical protein
MPKHQDRFYATTLRTFIILSAFSCIMFTIALCVAIGPALDWAHNYEEANCTVNNVETTGEVECAIPPGERANTQDKGLYVVPCVQVNVTYTNSSGSTRNCEVAMPRRGVLLAEYSAGSQQREYNSGDYIGPPIPGPNDKVDTRRTSTLTRALFATRTCTFLDCRSDRGKAEAVVREIADRYPSGSSMPCYVYKPRQHEVDLAALVVLKQVQSDAEVLGWTVTTLLAMLCSFPPCIFLCCREWLCRCPKPWNQFQYF